VEHTMAKDDKKKRKLPKIRIGGVKKKASQEKKEGVVSKATFEQKANTTRIKLPPELAGKGSAKPKRAPDDFPQPVPPEDIRDAAKNATARIVIDKEVIAEDSQPISPAIQNEATLEIDSDAVDKMDKSQTLEIDVAAAADNASASQTLEVSSGEVDAGTSQTIEILSGDVQGKGATLEINPEDILKDEVDEKVAVTPQEVKPLRVGPAKQDMASTSRIKLDIDQVKPTAAKPAEAKKVEPAKPAAAKPVEAKKAEPAKPAAAKPVEAKQSEPAKPAAAKPVEAKQSEPAKPAAAKPVEAKQPELAKPAEPAKPAEAKKAEPAGLEQSEAAKPATGKPAAQVPGKKPSVPKILIKPAAEAAAAAEADAAIAASAPVTKPVDIPLVAVNPVEPAATKPPESAKPAASEPAVSVVKPKPAAPVAEESAKPAAPEQPKQRPRTVKVAKPKTVRKLPSAGEAPPTADAPATGGPAAQPAQRPGTVKVSKPKTVRKIPDAGKVPAAQAPGAPVPAEQDVAFNAQTMPMQAQPGGEQAPAAPQAPIPTGSAPQRPRTVKVAKPKTVRKLPTASSPPADGQDPGSQAPQRPKTIMIKRPGQGAVDKPPAPTQKMPHPGQAPVDDDQIFGAQTMALSSDGIELDDEPATAATVDPGQRPKTIMIKRPSSSTARTVKTARPVMEGQISEAKSSTSKVDLPEGLQETSVTGHRKRTVKIRRPEEGAAPARGASTMAVERAAATAGVPVDGVEFHMEKTGIQGPGVFFTVLSVLSLLVIIAALYFLSATVTPDVPVGSLRLVENFQ
jgi:hypothetical protein